MGYERIKQKRRCVSCTLSTTSFSCKGGERAQKVWFGALFDNEQRSTLTLALAVKELFDSRFGLTLAYHDSSGDTERCMVDLPTTFESILCHTSSRDSRQM
jgi:hypothetical protein